MYNEDTKNGVQSSSIVGEASSLYVVNLGFTHKRHGMFNNFWSDP